MASEQAAANFMVTVLAPRIDGLLVRWEGDGTDDHSALPGSPLTGDDRWTRPNHVSHAAWLSIGHALDNLGAIRSLMVVKTGDEVQVVTRPYAVYPLIRAAMENACAALWLLGPLDRPGRVTRRTRMVVTDADNRDQAMRKADPSTSPILDKQKARARQLAEKHGLDPVECVRPVRYREIVRGAHGVIGLDPGNGEAIWRLLSGLTHGDSWASHTVTDRDEVKLTDDEDVFTIRATSSVTNVVNFVGIATSLTSKALSLFDDRRRPLFPGG